MDLAYSGFSGAETVVSLWIAVLSGYLVVAYAIGSKLTRLQVTVFNIAYSVWSIYLALSGTISLIRARSYLMFAAELDPIQRTGPGDVHSGFRTAGRSGVEP